MPFRNDSIYGVLRRIKEFDEYVLPAIQREFVWETDRIYNLLDSIVRNYPFGSMLFWEHRPKRFRKFDKKHMTTEPTYYYLEDNTQNLRKIMVLDGQQRVQSLYLALFGTVNGRQLYFNILSNPKVKGSDRRFEFEFLGEEEVRDCNASVIDFDYKKVDDFQYFIPVQKIVNLPSVLPYRRELVERLGKEIRHWDDRIEELIDTNLSLVHDRLRNSQNLNYFIVDESVIENFILDDILEIFVRINQGGVRLSRSDLMFSLINLKWKGDPWETFNRLLKELNMSNPNFEFEKDFIIKAFLLLEGLGARYEVDRLRDPKTIDLFEERFDSIGQAIKVCMDFVKKDAKILCSGVLGSYNALLPIIYWIYHKELNIIPPSEVDRIKHMLYMSLFTRATVRYADSRVNSLCYYSWGGVEPTGILATSDRFPLEESLAFIRNVERPPEITEDLLNQNMDLTLNIFHGGVQLEPNSSKNKPERDHVFPKSKLANMYPEQKINHFANMWFLPELLNRNKYNQPPLTYFKRAFRCDGEELARKLRKEKILPPEGALDLLLFKNYNEFFEARKNMILDEVREFLKLD